MSSVSFGHEAGASFSTTKQILTPLLLLLDSKVELRTWLKSYLKRISPHFCPSLFCSICHFLLLWRRRRKTLNSPYFPLFRAAEFPYILRFSTRFQSAKKKGHKKNLLRALHRAGKKGVCVWWPLGPSNHPTLTFLHMLGNACFGGVGHDLKLKWGLFKCPLKSPLSLSPRKGRFFIIFRVATFGNPWSFFSNLSRRRKPSCMEHNFGNGGREKSSSRIRIWRH